MSALEPRKPAATPFSARRRALGDISNRSTVKPPAPQHGKAVLLQTPGLQKSTRKALKSTKKSAARRNIFVDDVEQSCGRLGGDGSPPPLPLDLADLDLSLDAAAAKARPAFWEEQAAREPREKPLRLPDEGAAAAASMDLVDDVMATLDAELDGGAPVLDGDDDLLL